MPNKYLDYEVLQLKNTVNSLKNKLKKQEEEKVIKELRERVCFLEKEIKNLKDFKKVNDIKADINSLKSDSKSQKDDADDSKKQKIDNLKNIAKKVATGAGGVGLVGTLLLLAKRYGMFDKISKAIASSGTTSSGTTSSGTTSSGTTSNDALILQTASRILRKPVSEIKSKGISDEEKNTLMRNNINPNDVISEI